jgi:hypothetical protein
MGNPLDIRLYRKYLQEYVTQALRDSDGTVSGVREYLDSIQVRGFLVSHKLEKQRALADAVQAFSEHSHWPLEIILSHLGIEKP